MPCSKSPSVGLGTSAAWVCSFFLCAIAIIAIGESNDAVFDPAIALDAKVIAERKREIRRFLSKESKTTIPLSTAPLDQPFNYWKCAKDYREHSGKPLQVYAKMGRDLAHADKLVLTGICVDGGGTTIF